MEFDVFLPDLAAAVNAIQPEWFLLERQTLLHWNYVHHGHLLGRGLQVLYRTCVLVFQKLLDECFSRTRPSAHVDSPCSIQCWVQPKRNIYNLTIYLYDTIFLLTPEGCPARLPCSQLQANEHLGACRTQRDAASRSPPCPVLGIEVVPEGGRNPKPRRALPDA